MVSPSIVAFRDHRSRLAQMAFAAQIKPAGIAWRRSRTVVPVPPSFINRRAWPSWNAGPSSTTCRRSPPSRWPSPLGVSQYQSRASQSASRGAGQVVPGRSCFIQPQAHGAGVVGGRNSTARSRPSQPMALARIGREASTRTAFAP